MAFSLLGHQQSSAEGAQGLAPLIGCMGAARGWIQNIRGKAQQILIQQDHHHPLDPVVFGSIGTNAQRMGVPAKILHFQDLGCERLNHFGQQTIQLGDLQIQVDIGDGPAHIGGNQIQSALRNRRESADAKVVAQHHNRYIHAAEQVLKIVSGLSDLKVSGLQLLIDGVQFLVGGL